MSRDVLIVIGVVLIILVVLGSTYMAVSRGVAPSLLGGEIQESPGGTTVTSGVTTTNTKAGKTTTKNAPFTFSDIFLKKKEFSITYDYYQDGEKKGSGSFYIKGVDKRRMDFKSSEGQVIVIYKGNEITYCFKQAQVGWKCYKSTNKAEIERKIGGKSANDPVEEGQEKFKTPVYNGTRTYAGKRCYCYYVTGSGDEIINGVKKSGTQWVEICVTQDGIPAYYMYLWKSSDGKNKLRTDIIARTISYSVQDNVFNPPAEPAPLP